MAGVLKYQLLVIIYIFKVLRVGFDGYQHSTELASTQQNYLYYSTNDVLDAQGPLLLQGIEWVFTWLECTMAYAISVAYESEYVPTNILDFENLLWSYDHQLSLFLLLSVIQDLQTIHDLFVLPHITNWYNYAAALASDLVHYIEHPEHAYYYKGAIAAYILPYISHVRFIVESESTTEGFTFIPFIILDIFWKLAVLGWFISFMMHWYDNSATSNNIDVNFLVNSLTIEAEEEIASISDTVVLLIIIFFIFGWFFFFNYINILTFVGEIMFIFMFLPLLLYILLLIPIYLLWDYGTYFLAYLRGAGSTSSLFMEFVYDCIAFLAFFIRLSVQNVRLLLITFTFFSLYEFILFFSSASWFNSNFENLTHSISSSTGAATPYYYFLYLSNKALFWLYELLHTFFVTIAQFTAFFAMVFWLFLFLYTMFVIEEFENYLSEKRKNILL